MAHGPDRAFGQETAVHALRLMGSGLFDAYPRPTIILGHMGEGLPYSCGVSTTAMMGQGTQHGYPAKRKIGDYFTRTSTSRRPAISHAA